MADLAASLGMPLDEWQEQALEAAMGERLDGRWASKFVGMSVPRQNGKSQIIVARALAGVLLFDEKMIIISAHETDTAREVWKRLIDVVEDNPNLERRVTGRMDAINREFLAFGKGAEKQTIKLKARRASGSRGFSADCLLLDEAQILGKRAWGSIVPTMSARPNPQLWLFGTPPTEDDDPFAFERVRSSSLKRKVRHCWLEWSADPSDDFDDPATWAKANPSYGVRISEEACADDRSAMDDEQFGMERLGIWPGEGDAGWAIVPSSEWRAGLRAELQLSKLGLRPSLALAASRDLSSAAIVAAAKDGEEVWVRVLAHGPGVSWVPAQAKALQAEHRSPLILDKGGPAASLIDDLEEQGVRLREVALGDVCDAAASFVTALTETHTIRHMGDPELTDAMRVATWREIGDRRAFGRKAGDITPLEGASLAAHHAQRAYDVLSSGY